MKLPCPVVSWFGNTRQFLGDLKWLQNAEELEKADVVRLKGGATRDALWPPVLFLSGDMPHHGSMDADE